MKYYLVGIKGTGMSALAKVLQDLGYEVLGSDVRENYFTDESLKKRNIKVLNFNKKNIKEECIYIASSCYDESNVEIKEIKNKGYKLYYYHEFIGEFFKGEKIGISGTHGKTTTTHILNCLFNGEKRVAIIGDGYGRGDNNYQYYLFEACEYKNHFLSYSYDTLLINNIDLDHLDYYNNINDCIDSFQKAADKSERIVINIDDDNARKIKHKNIITFGLNEAADIYGKIVEEYINGYLIEVKVNNKKYRYILNNTGKFFIYDFLGALSIYYIYNFDLLKVQEKMNMYKNPERRMNEYIYLDNIVVDDYAHHPSEIKECLNAIKQKYSNKKLIVIFEPHTYTRTIRLKDKFRDVFNEVDELYLAKTFTSKREKKSRDLEAEVLKIFKNAKRYDKKIFAKFKKEKNNVIVIMGAGNLLESIKGILKT